MRLYLFLLGLVLLIPINSISAMHVNKNSDNGAWIDLRNIDFSSSLATLDGAWEIYWNQLLDPSQLDKVNGKQIISLPHSWNGYELDNGEIIRSYGFATFRVFVSVEKRNEVQSFALFLNRVGTNYKLWINGQLRSELGVVGKTREASVPIRRIQVVPFDHFTDGTPIEIVIQVSNFHHNSGGLKDPIYFGHTDKILYKNYISYCFDVASTFILLTAFAYHIFIFFVKRTDIIQKYIAVFLLLLTGFVAGTGQNFVTVFFPGINWFLYMKALHLTVTLPVLFYNLLVQTMFYKEKIRVVGNMINFTVIAFSLLVIVTPISFFTRYFKLFHLSFGMVLVYWFYVLVFACIRKRPGAKTVFLGFALYALFAYLEMLYVNEITIFPRFLPLSILSLVFSYIMILVRNYSASFETIKKVQSQKEFTVRQLNEVKTKESETSKKLELIRKQSLQIEKELSKSRNQLSRIKESFSTPDYISGINDILNSEDNILFIKTSNGICGVFDRNGKPLFDVNVSLKRILESEVLKGSFSQVERRYATNPENITAITRVDRKYFVILNNQITIPGGKIYLDKLRLEPNTHKNLEYMRSLGEAWPTK